MIRLLAAADLGPLLADLRRLNQTTQRQLAEDSHTRQGQISNFELGATRPNLESLIRLATALGYDLALIPREDEVPKPTTCGCPVAFERVRVERHTAECGTRRAAERLSSYLELEDA